MATVGIDLSPLQTAHRMRGVGATALNILTNISDINKREHVFVFFLYEEEASGILELINASAFQNYEVRYITQQEPSYLPLKSLKGLFELPRRYKDSRMAKRIGTRHITDVQDIEVFLQFEQDIIPPKGVESVVVAHDLIPYILESDYLWNYSTARHMHHYSRRGAVLCHLRRESYLRNIRAVTRRATKVLANSKQTMQDFKQYTRVTDDKIRVCHLGINSLSSQKRIDKPQSVIRYINSQWGDVESEASLPKTPFLLFVGGSDARRKVSELISAFNQLRGLGYDLHLVLAGDTMKGPNSVPNPILKRALLSSSYLDDIYMLGYVNDTTREWLYSNATAFIYPTKYEGFGLPVLEALRYGTPVITSYNSSLKEIADDVVDYADTGETIREGVIRLINSSDAEKASSIRKKQAERFSWADTAKTVMEELDKITQRK